MKVYFETNGGGNGKLWISVYVNPTDDGHGYFYTPDGTECRFAWVHPSEAIVFDSEELPEELWYSIQHGVHFLEIDVSKRKNWTWDDLEYNKVSKEQVEALIAVKERINDVKTFEEFKELYPLIKKSNVISHPVMDKLFALSGLPELDVMKAKNGEIGIATYQKSLYYKALLIEYGLEPSPSSAPEQ